MGCLAPRAAPYSVLCSYLLVSPSHSATPSCHRDRQRWHQHRIIAVSVNIGAATAIDIAHRYRHRQNRPHARNHAWACVSIAQPTSQSHISIGIRQHRDLGFALDIAIAIDRIDVATEPSKRAGTSTARSLLSRIDRIVLNQAQREHLSTTPMLQLA